MNQLVINADQGVAKVNRNIYGHFSEHLGRCVYEGIWVGEDSPIPNTRGMRNDVVEALRQLRVPVLRWPGGCFADEYHWIDGVGPREQRPVILNTHWGGVTENNHFGTHEFLDFCSLIGAEPYICSNVGSGTVQELQQWVEYITFDGRSPMADRRRRNGREEPWRLLYLGVGNENWGCGGHMRPEYYADEYRRYQTYARNLSGNTLYKIACGANSSDYHWTEVLMREAARYMHGLSLHYYTRPPREDGASGSATGFGEREWFGVLRNAFAMDALIGKHSEIMDHYDPERRVGMVVDEWGAWYDVEPGTNPGFLYQQNTIRDALVAGLTLNIFNAHCERVSMANLAQTMNVLQSVILTDKDCMVTTPTYHVFDMYKAHQDATLLPCCLDAGDYVYGGEHIPQVSVSASRHSEGDITVTLCNTSPSEGAELYCEVRGAALSQAEGRVLTADSMDAHNTFEKPDNVVPTKLEDVVIQGGSLKALLPPMSVVSLCLASR